MAVQSVFLSGPEQDEFAKPGRVVAREVTRIGPDVATGRVDLADLVTTEARHLTRSQGTRFACLTIAVHDRDGMTWCAESVAAAIGRSFPENFTVYGLTRDAADTELPALTALTGETPLLSAAARHGLTVSFLHLKSPAVFLVAALLTLLGAAAIVLKTLLDAARTNGPFAWSAIWLAVGLAGLAVLSGWVKQALEPHTREASRQRFAERMKVACRSREYHAFVDDLARRLRADPFPRVVVVDNFERLDPTTRDVIARYFERFADGAMGGELWVVFEPRDGQSLSAEGLRHSGTFGYQRMRMYELALVTAEQKRGLRHLLSRPESAEDFATIGRVCLDSVEGDNATLTMLEEYHRREPPPVGSIPPFRLLYLLSLASSVGGQFVSERAIASELSRSSRWRTPILRKFLGATNIDRNGLVDALRVMRREFPRAVIVRDEGGDPQVLVRPEIEGVMSRRAPGLRLPPADLGHVFWALLLHDRSGNRPLDAFDCRKLAFHVLHASPTPLADQELYQSLLAHLVEVTIAATAWSLRAGVLKTVPELVRRAVGWFQSEPATEQPGHRARLQRLCWDAFALLGDLSLLDAMLEVREPAGEPPPAGRDDPRARLEGFFCDGLALDPGRRAAIAGELFPPPGRTSPTRESIADYARLQAAWVGLTVRAFPLMPPQGALAGLARDAGDTVGPATRDAMERAAGREERSLAALVAVALGVWCHALRSTQGDRVPAWLIGLLRPMSDAAADAAPGGDPIDEAVDACETAVLLADELQASALRQAGAEAVDFPRDVLVREICAVSLAALSLVGEALTLPDEILALQPPGADRLHAGRLPRIAGVVSMAAHLLGVPLRAVTTVADLRDPSLQAALTDLWPLHGVVWRRFGLDRLAAVVELRHLQYEAMRRPFRAEDQPRHEPLVRAVSASAPDGASRLVADLSLAWAYRETAELHAFYLSEAAHAAQGKGYADDVRRELCWLAVMAGAHVHERLTECVDALMEPGATGDPFVKTVVEGLPAAEQVGVALRLLNAEHSPRVRAMIESLAAGAPADVAGELGALLELRDLETRARDRAPLPLAATLLTAWQNRRSLWLYPWLLSVLLRADGPDPALAGEASAVLDHDPAEDSFNTYLFLALDLADDLPDEPGGTAAGPALRYLEDALPRWTGQLSVENNLRAYRTLYRHALDRKPEYLEALTKWEAVRLHRDHVRHLKQFAEHGRFFLVFLSYFQTMASWGLRSEPPSKLVLRSLREPPADHRAALGEMARGAVALPSAIWGRGGDAVVGGQFVTAGSLLFTPPLEDDPAYDDLRARFHAEAGRALPWLLDLVVELPDLPLLLKQLVTRYSADLLGRGADPAGRRA